MQRPEYTLGHVPTSFTQNNQRYYILADQIGSPKLIVDENGNTVKQLDYDSFGNLITDSNPDFAIPFGFAGGLQDNDTGLIRFGYRDYDPETGRWTARDPIGFAGGDTNLYGYVLGDSINLVDPSGLLASQMAGGTFSIVKFIAQKVVKACKPKGEKGRSGELDEKRKDHIFRDKKGHLKDTPENRKLLENTANDEANLLGKDKYGNVWHARMTKEGKQIWTQSRDGKIINGGSNDIPRTYNPNTGLSAEMAPK